MADFKKAFKKTMAHEGIYSNDPHDFGGETYMGISRRYHPNWPGWQDIDEVKARHKNELVKNKKHLISEFQHAVVIQHYVETFYREHFWDKFCGDEILYQDLAEEMFDTAINLGITRAVMYLQKAMNYLNRNQKLCKNLVVDGKFGKKTFQTLKIFEKVNDIRYIIKIINILQGCHYLRYMQRSETQERFARGWLNRVYIEKT